MPEHDDEQQFFVDNFSGQYRAQVGALQRRMEERSWNWRRPTFRSLFAAAINSPNLQGKG